MKAIRFLSIAFLFLVVFLVMPLVAEELHLPYIKKGACPFEGCSYGKWTVLKETLIYSEPSKDSIIVGKLRPEEIINSITGEVHIVPGKAIIVDSEEYYAAGLVPEKELYILDYIGEGRSRVFQDGKFVVTKIARTNNRCIDDYKDSHCWADVIAEPKDYWWVFIKTSNNIEGWVLIEEENINPIDLLSLNVF